MDRAVRGHHDRERDVQLHGLPVRVDQHGDAGRPEEVHGAQVEDDGHGLRLLEQPRECGTQPWTRFQVDLAGGGEHDRRAGINRGDPQSLVTRLNEPIAFHAA